MPKISVTQDIDIKPERFLNQCSASELFELWRLIQQKSYQDKIDLLLNGSIATSSEEVKDQQPAIQYQTPKIIEVAFAANPTYENRSKLLICGVTAEVSVRYVQMLVAGKKARYVNYKPDYDANDFDLLEGNDDIDFFVILNIPAGGLVTLTKFSTIGVPVAHPGKEPRFIHPHIIATTPESFEFASQTISVSKRFMLLSPYLDQPTYHGTKVKYRKYCDDCGKPKHCEMYGIKYLCDECANAPAFKNQ